MNPGGRPPGTSNEDEAGARMRAAALAQEEDRHLRATINHRRQDLVAVRLHKARGMSRKRLIEIYGRDIVDQALAG